MIDTSDALKSLIGRAVQNKCVALDTEFVWERTYYPMLGVVQIGFSEKENFLIDVPAIDDLAPLGQLLADPTVAVVLHDAQQDLTILRRATGAYPRNVFDTRCAAGFAGLSSSTSLHDLLLQILGVELVNTETRTNWLHRPLSQRQVSYALDDVRYLLTPRQELLSRAQEFNRETWLREELAGYDNPDLYEEKDPRQQFLRLKGTGRFSARDLAVLRELTAWREEEARRRDRPRGHIVTDKALVDLARRKPQSLPALKPIQELFRRGIRLYGGTILERIAQGLAVRAEECPQPFGRPRDKRPFRSRLRNALAYMKEKSVHCQIDPALVATRSEVEDLVLEGHTAAPEHHRLLRGWRREFLGAELLQLSLDAGADKQ